MAHVLVVGGSGMLAGVSEFIAENDNVVSVVARDEIKILKIAQATAGRGKINPIAVDYHEKENLKAKLEQAIREYGPIQLVISWIHSSAADAAELIANVISETSPVCRYFHVLGSTALDSPSAFAEAEKKMNAKGNILYRKVILGNVEDPTGERWLTHSEICEGVISAIRADQKESLVGSPVRQAGT